jgi:hypothetical protein
VVVLTATISSSPASCLRDRGGLLGWNGVVLLLYSMIADVGGADRPECPRSEVEEHARKTDAARGEGREKPVGEVKPRGRCGHGPGNAGIDRLVIVPLRWIVRSVDVGWQRHMTACRE